MSEKSGIEWTDATWNPVTGCTRVSAGCARCYAYQLHDQRFVAQGKAASVALGNAPHPDGVKLAHRRAIEQARELGLKLPLPAQYDVPFSVVQLHPERLEAPLHWRKPRRVFVNSMSDLFHEDIPDDFLDRVFAVMALTPQHTYQVLTKRPERMREYLSCLMPAVRLELAAKGLGYTFTYWGLGAPAGGVWAGPDWPLPNVWLGVSAEDQEQADKRIPVLLDTLAAVRFVSCEPLLGPIDLTAIDYSKSHRDRLIRLLRGRDDEALNSILAGMDHPDAEPFAANVLTGRYFDGWDDVEGATIDWVIVGGESGPGARPCDVEWIRSIVRQCQAAEVPVFVKQLGSRPYVTAGADGNFHEDARAWPHKRAWDVGLRAGVAVADIRLRDRKGGNPEEWPEELRVREWPRA